MFHLETRAGAAETPFAMPLHFYAPLARPCRLCGDGFDHVATARAEPLTKCPTCGQSVHRAAVQSLRILKLSPATTVSRASQVGFTVLKRTSDGRFEKQ
jgi:predicted nucleic acid-binding Zn ribbon protein